MAQEALYDLPDFRALQAALEEEWPHRSAALRAAGVPLNEGDDDTDDTGDTDDTSGDHEQQPAPPWGDDFNPERAWNTIKSQREEAARLKREKQELAGRLQQFEDANKSELEKAQEAATSATQRASAAEAAALQIEVALDKAPEGMPIAQVRKLAKRLTGTNREELEADAEELFADFVPAEDDQASSSSRPRERLRPGAAPGGEPEETNPAKLAEMVSEQRL